MKRQIHQAKQHSSEIRGIEAMTFVSNHCFLVTRCADAARRKGFTPRWKNHETYKECPLMKLNKKR